jgi:hypothetical protein
MASEAIPTKGPTATDRSEQRLGPFGLWGTTVAGPLLLLLSLDQDKLLPLPVLLSVSVAFLYHAMRAELTAAIPGDGSAFSIARVFLGRRWARVAGLAELYLLSGLALGSGIAMLAGGVDAFGWPGGIAVTIVALALQLGTRRVGAALWVTLALAALILFGGSAIIASFGRPSAEAADNAVLWFGSDAGDSVLLSGLAILIPVLPCLTDDTDMPRQGVARVAVFSSLTVCIAAAALVLPLNRGAGTLAGHLSQRAGTGLVCLGSFATYCLTWRAAANLLRRMSRAGHLSDSWEDAPIGIPRFALLGVWFFQIAFVIVTIAVSGVSWAVLDDAASTDIFIALGAPVVLPIALTSVSYLSFRFRNAFDEPGRYRAPLGAPTAVVLIVASVAAAVVPLVMELSDQSLSFDLKCLVAISLSLAIPAVWCVRGGRGEKHSSAEIVYAERLRERGDR